MVNPDESPILKFSERVHGRVICMICREVDGVHMPSCPIVELDTEVRELTAHTGVFLANVHESLENICRILRSGREPDKGQP